VLVGRVCWLPDVLAGSEWFLISDLDLPRSVFLAQHGGSSVLERITNSVVRCLHEEDLVAGTLFHGTSLDIARIDDDFFDVGVRGDSGLLLGELRVADGQGCR